MNKVLLRYTPHLIVLVLIATDANADTLTGRVVKIADGDTVTVLDTNNEKHRIRLSGIDAPERKQPFGKRSKQNLSRLVAGKPVTVVYEKRNRYERIIGKVMVALPDACDVCPKRLDTSLAQIRAGLAWWYRKYAKEQSAADRQLYEAAEDQARANKAGLWADNAPVAPWDWRKR